MNKDITYCSALFCDLSKRCKRKGYEGKPDDPTLSFLDFQESLHLNDVDEWVCDDQLESELGMIK